MDILTELREHQIVAVVVNEETYGETVEQVAARLSSAYRVCYVSMNKPYTLLVKRLAEKHGTPSRVLYVDCVSGSVRPPEHTDVLFVSSPKALTELSITISQALERDIDAVLFDSLSTLLLYSDPPTAVKFIHSLISRLRMTDKKCVLLLLEADLNAEVFKDLSMFVNRVVHIPLPGSK